MALACEATDGRAHGRLELHYLRALLVPRVYGLIVLHHRQGQGSTALVEELLQLAQVDPKVVRVEVAVLRHVLCFLSLSWPFSMASKQAPGRPSRPLWDIAPTPAGSIRRPWT